MKAIDYRDTLGLKTRYDQLGYCLATGIYTPEQIDRIEAAFEEFKKAEAIFDGSSRYTEASREKRQVRALHPHRFSEEVKAWFLEPRIVSVLEGLLEKPPLGAQTMYYYKPPGSRGESMHQDNYPLAAAPAACIGAWTAVDDADSDNGCLRLIPGSHRYKLLCPDGKLARSPDELSYSNISRLPKGPKAEAEAVKRGETLFFHGHTVHGSGPNRTKDRYRRTFIGHYVDEATETLADFYHPILDMNGETVSRIKISVGGGLCG